MKSLLTSSNVSTSFVKRKKVPPLERGDYKEQFYLFFKTIIHDKKSCIISSFENDMNID